MIGSGCERCGQGGMIVPLSRRGRRAWTDTGAWITVAKKRPGCPGSDFFLVERSYVCHLFALRISLSPPLSPLLPSPYEILRTYLCSCYGFRLHGIPQVCFVTGNKILKILSSLVY